MYKALWLIVFLQFSNNFVAYGIIYGDLLYFSDEIQSICRPKKSWVQLYGRTSGDTWRPHWVAVDTACVCSIRKKRTNLTSGRMPLMGKTFIPWNCLLLQNPVLLISRKSFRQSRVLCPVRYPATLQTTCSNSPSFLRMFVLFAHMFIIIDTRQSRVSL